MMVWGSGVRQVPGFLLGEFGGLCGAVLEAEAVVSGFENVAAVGEAIQQRGRHFRVAEHGGPFAEAQVRRDDDAGPLIEFAQQMEEQSTSGSAERQVAEFVEDDEVGIGEPPRNLAGLPLVLFLFEGVDEFDGGEEPDALAVMLDGLDTDRRGEMRFPRAGRDSDTAPGVWRVRRRSPTRSTRSPG
jgi:hypothetical protein